MRATKHKHRDEWPGSHARRYRDDEVAGCVQEVSARRLSPREADGSRRTRAASSSSVGSHGRVLAPISIAVHRQFRFGRRHFAVAFLDALTLLYYILYIYRSDKFIWRKVCANILAAVFLIVTMTFKIS